MKRVITASTASTEYLCNKDGEVWVDSEGNKVPKVCPECGADVGLFMRGEPVFVCKGEHEHYLGTAPLEV